MVSVRIIDGAAIGPCVELNGEAVREAAIAHVVSARRTDCCTIGILDNEREAIASGRGRSAGVADLKSKGRFEPGVYLYSCCMPDSAGLVDTGLRKSKSVAVLSGDADHLQSLNGAEVGIGELGLGAYAREHQCNRNANRLKVTNRN